MRRRDEKNHETCGWSRIRRSERDHCVVKSDGEDETCWIPHLLGNVNRQSVRRCYGSRVHGYNMHLRFVQFEDAWSTWRHWGRRA